MKGLVSLPLLPAILGVCLCCAALGNGAAAEAGKAVTIHQVPAAVKTTIEQQAEGWKIGNIQREEDEGEVTFMVTITKASRESSFNVAEDGTLMSVEMELEDVPPAVQKAIAAQVGQGTVQSIDKNLEESEPSYEIEFQRPDGADRFMSLAEDGRITALQIALQETPLAVRKTFEANLGKGKLGDVYRLVEKGETSYDAEVAFEGRVRDLIVSAEGKLESVQVFLSETPPAVQKTIQERLGNGKLIRIDRSYEPRMGVLPFEVEARKDGRPFNFGVGPKGRFLGINP